MGFLRRRDNEPYFVEEPEEQPSVIVKPGGAMVDEQWLSEEITRTGAEESRRQAEAEATRAFRNGMRRSAAKRRKAWPASTRSDYRPSCLSTCEDVPMTLDHDVIEHEASHAAMATMTGIEVSRVDAIGGDGYQGQLRYRKSLTRDQRREEVMVLLAGGDIPDGEFPPNAVTSNSHDLAHVHRIIRETQMTASEWYRLKVQTEELAETPEFKALQQRFESALVGNGGVLDEEAVDSVIRRWKWDNDGG